MNEYTITSFIDYINIITKINEQNSDQFFLPEGADMRSIYRGHSNLEWEFEPSLFRLKNGKSNETIYLKEFIRIFPNETDNQSKFDILTTAQHYGLPTRLLDYTFNPLIALYFACIENLDKDGLVIIKTKQPIWNYDSITVNVLMNVIFNFPNYRNDKKIGDKVKYSLDKDPNISRSYDKEDILKIIESNYINYIKPKLINNRIRLQNGLFALYPLQTNDTYIDSNVEDIHKIIIDKKSKINILQYLDYFDINQGSIFPELENLLKGMRTRIDGINDNYFDKLIL